MEIPALNSPTLTNTDYDLNISSQENIISLCVSIFYDKTMWDVLIVEAIKPFINNNKGFSFFFYLNEHRGPNIRLVFMVKEKEALDFAKSIDSFFTVFLSEVPSCLLVNKEDFFQFFMNFHNNTIHYGLFENESDHFQDFNIGLTDLLFFVFTEYKNEFHLSINEIMYQIITIFFNALKIVDDQILKIFRNFIENENEHRQYGRNLPHEIRDLHEQYFLENKDILLSYLKEYRKANADTYEEEWEKKWHNFVCSFFNNSFVDQNNEVDIVIALNKIMEVFNVRNKISFYYLFINGIERYNI